MEQEIITLKQTVESQTEKIDQIQAAIEKMRKYFLVTAWVTVLAIVVPLIGLFFIGPTFINLYITGLQVTD